MRSFVRAFLVLATVVVTSFANADLGTVNVMEARNFIAAREMAFGGSWLLPTMNGQLRIAKPPLPTWPTAVLMRMTGTDADLAVNRIPAGVCGVLLAAFTFLLARRITGEGKLALLSMLVMCTSYIFLLSVRKNTWDIFSVTFMTGALWALAEIVRRPAKAAVFVPAASVMMACAFMSKGPVPFGVMLVPFVAAYAAAFGFDDLKNSLTPLLAAAFLCAVLSGLWPLYVYMNTPHAAAAVAAKETSGWFTRHTQPAWYYLLHLQELAGVWVFFLLAGVYETLVRRDRDPRARFFVWWFILTVAVVSVFPEKKLRYLLGAVVPASAVCAVALQRLKGGARPLARAVNGAFGIVTGLLFAAGSGALVYYDGWHVQTVFMASALAVPGAWLVLTGVRGKASMNHQAAVAGICLAVVFLTPTLRAHVIGDEAAPFMRIRHTEAFRGLPFFSLGEVPAEVIWASGRVIGPLSAEDLARRATGEAPFVLVVEGEGKHPGAGFRLAETVTSGRRVYRFYLHGAPAG